jgi:hypothetical protein
MKPQFNLTHARNLKDSATDSEVLLVSVMVEAALLTEASIFLLDVNHIKLELFCKLDFYSKIAHASFVFEDTYGRLFPVHRLCLLYDLRLRPHGHWDWRVIDMTKLFST